MTPGSEPESPFSLSTRAVTRPRESVSTPCHFSKSEPLSQPSDSVHSPPAASSYRLVSALWSEALQNGPNQPSTPSSHSTNTDVPGAHRPLFPAQKKLRSGNIVTEVGIASESSFLERCSTTRFDSPPSSGGIAPESSFRSKVSRSRLDRPPSSDGIAPESSFRSRTSCSRLDRPPSSDGIAPESPFSRRDSTSRFGSPPSSGGIAPESSFRSRTSHSSFDSSPNSDGSSSRRPCGM